MPSFRQYLTRQAPISLAGEWGSKIVNLLGLIGDMAAELALEAVKARSLYSRTFPLDALRFVGDERSMPRYPIETDAMYLARLKTAWHAWTIAGTAQAVNEQFTAAGWPNDVKENADWNWDGNAADSRFWVVLTQHNFTRWVLGNDHSFDEGIVLGSTAKPDDITLMRAIARKWKAGHVRLSHVILVFDMATWLAQQPNGTWQDVNQRSAAVSCIPG